jgi:hypothetical protein
MARKARSVFPAVVSRLTLQRQQLAVAASIQEQVLAAWSASVMGRRYVFEPDTYKKGKHAIREPADLAWHCHDTTLLMYMKSGGKGWQRDTEANLRQARGWISEWREGRRLRGKSDDEVFSVAYTSDLAIVVLLVSADPALDQIHVHDEIARELGVHMCATVSQRFIEAAVWGCMGVANLTTAIKRWPRLKQAHPPLTDIQLVQSLLFFSANAAGQVVGWMPTPPNADVDLFALILKDFRSVRESSVGKELGATPSQVPVTAPLRKRGNIEPNRFFADLGIVEHYHLLFTLGRMAELVREGMPFMTASVELDRYTVVFQLVEHPRHLPQLPAMLPKPFDIAFCFVLGHQLGFFVPSGDMKSPTRAWKALREEDKPSVEEPALSVSGTGRQSGCDETREGARAAFGSGAPRLPLRLQMPGWFQSKLIGSWFRWLLDRPWLSTDDALRRFQAVQFSSRDPFDAQRRPSAKPLLMKLAPGTVAVHAWVDVIAPEFCLGDLVHVIPWSIVRYRAAANGVDEQRPIHRELLPELR